MSSYNYAQGDVQNSFAGYDEELEDDNDISELNLNPTEFKLATDFFVESNFEMSDSICEISSRYSGQTVYVDIYKALNALTDLKEFRPGYLNFIIRTKGSCL